MPKVTVTVVKRPWWERDSKKKIAALLILWVVLEACVSTGNYSPDMPDLFLGKILLRLENYGSRSGTYTTGVYASFKNKETGVVTSFGLDHEGYFETSQLDAGVYILTGLWVDQLVVPLTQNFNLPMNFEFRIERNQVNVFGQLTLTLDQEGQSKSELNLKVEEMKVFFVTKAPGSEWLNKSWRPIRRP